MTNGHGWAVSTQHRFSLGFSYESVCRFIDCSKEAVRVKPADHDVREIRREDGGHDPSALFVGRSRLAGRYGVYFRKTY